MIISDVTQVPTLFTAASTTQAEPPVDENPEVLPQAEAADPAPVEAEAEGGRGDGVLRKLLDGQFNGVADVRLRINFHDELAAAAAAAVESAAGEAGANVSSAVGAQLDELSSALALSDEQLGALSAEQQAFSEAVSGAAEAFSGAAEGAGESLTGGLQQAFDSLVAAVQAVIAPEPPEPAPPPAIPADADGHGDGDVNVSDPGIIAASIEPMAVEEQLAAVQEVFAAAMQELADALAGASALPELSLPTGNGVAYNKFLAVYNTLFAAPEAADGDPQPALDTTA